MHSPTSHQSLVLSLVRALQGEVHPQLRQASIEVDERACIVRVRFEYDGDTKGAVRESGSCAATEVIADFPGPWNLDEQHVSAPFPNSLVPLEHVVYRRWEPDDLG
jgi:hypothetical protein